jgi:hypothetical protein
LRTLERKLAELRADPREKKAQKQKAAKKKQKKEQAVVQ